MTDDPRAEEIKAAARDLAEEAIAALRQVMNDPLQKGAARVAAGKAVLERGFGAPDRKIEKTVDHHIHDHRTAHLRALETLASRQNALPPPREHIADAEFEEIARDERS